MMHDDLAKVRSTLETISAGVMADSGDDIRWGDAWEKTIRRIDVQRVVKACMGVLHGGSASKAELEEARLCLHLARGGFKFAKCIRETKADSCYRNPGGEKIPDLWKKLYSYYRGQFPQLEMQR